MATEPTFGKTDRLYSITEGYVLVRKNTFTGNIKASGKYAEEERRNVPTSRVVMIGNLTDAELETVTRQAERRENTRVLEYLRQEKRRRRNGDAPIPGVSDQRIKWPTNLELKKKRMKARLGIKIRWPWETVLVLPTTEQKIDTPAMTVDTREGIRIQFDTDYHYRIIDPVAFAKIFNSKSGNAFSEVEKDIGGKLDELVRRYMKKNISEIQTRPTLDLLEELRDEADIITTMYGVELTYLLVKDIKLPDEVIKAEAERKAAEAKAAAKSRENEVEAEKSTKELERIVSFIMNSESESGKKISRTDAFRLAIEWMKAYKAEKNSTFSIDTGILSSILGGGVARPVEERAAEERPVERPAEERSDEVRPIERTAEERTADRESAEEETAEDSIDSRQEKIDNLIRKEIGRTISPVDLRFTKDAWARYVETNPAISRFFREIPTVTELNEDLLLAVFAANGITIVDRKEDHKRK